MIIPMIFIFLSCREKAHDNKEFSPEISKSCLNQESRPVKSNTEFWSFDNFNSSLWGYYSIGFWSFWHLN